MAQPTGKGTVIRLGAKPRLLGRYHVLDEIGRNAVGALYLARLEGPKGFQRWAAIRRVDRIHVAEDGYVQRFFERVKEGAKLLHPNVTALFDVGEDDEAPWVAMEYLHGERIEEVIERLEMADTPVSWEIAARIVSDIAEGLHAVHNLRDKENKPLGLLHGDLAPHSVVVTYEGKSKIKGAFEPRAHGVLDPRKVPYAAPEQLFDGVVDSRADVFALGVVLWELLAGKRLFWRKTEDETRAMIEAGVVPPLADVVSEVPAELDALVRKTLFRNPAQRFTSARELSRELESLLVAKGMVARDDDVGRYMRTLFADRFVEQEAVLQAAADITEVFRRSRPVIKDAVGTLPDLSVKDEEDDAEQTELMRSPLAEDEDRTTAERPVAKRLIAAPPTERDLVSGFTDEIVADSGPTLPRRLAPIATSKPSPSEKLSDTDEVPTVTAMAPIAPMRAGPRQTRSDDETVPATGPRLIIPSSVFAEKDDTESAIFVAPRLPNETPNPDQLPPRPVSPSFPDRPLLPMTPPDGAAKVPFGGSTMRMGQSDLARPMAPAFSPPPFTPPPFPASRGPYHAVSSNRLQALLPRDRNSRLALAIALAGSLGVLAALVIIWATMSRRPTEIVTTYPTTSTAPVVSSVTATSAPPTTTTPPVATPTIPIIELTSPRNTGTGRPRGRVPVVVTTQAPPPPPPPPPPSNKTGFVTVYCKPNACDHVVESGHDLGGTPVIRQELSVGKHRLTLRVEGKPDKSVTVDIPEGENVTIRPDTQ